MGRAVRRPQNATGSFIDGQQRRGDRQRDVGGGGRVGVFVLLNV